MLTNYALLVQSRRNPSHSPLGSRNSGHSTQRSDILKNVFNRSVSKKNTINQNETPKSLGSRSIEKQPPLKNKSSFDSFIVKLKINDYETHVYNLLVLNNESDFDLIAHPLTSQQVYPTTQPLKLSLTIERDWRQSLCLYYLSTDLISHLHLIAQLTVP